MSFYKNNFNRIKVTGLTAGSWTTVNIAALAAGVIPAGAKNVHLKYDSVALLSTTYGARKVGSADTFTNAANARVKSDRWVELTSGQIELFIGSNSNGEWYIEGFDTHFTFLTTAIQKGGSVGAGTYTLDYSAELPAAAAGGTVIMELSRGVRIGTFGNVPLTGFNPLPRGQVMLPLDSLRRLQYISAGGTTLDSDLSVVAWAPPGAVIHSTTFTSRTVGSTGAWLPLPDVSTETVLGLWRLFNASDNVFWGMRASDNSTDNDVDTNLLNRYTYAKNGADGVTNVNVNNTGVQFYYFGGIAASVAPANIVGIDQLVAGQTSTVTISNTTFVPVSFGLSDGAVTKNVSATLVSPGVYSFACPLWVDGTTGLKFGTVNVTASDGTESTPSFAKTLTSWTGTTVQTLDAVSTYNYGSIGGYSPALLIGSQIVYVTADGIVYTDGIWDDNGTGFTGATTIWDRDPGTGIVRSGSIVVAVSGTDTDPDAGTFGSASGAALSTFTQLPTTVTIAGVTAATDIGAIPGVGTEIRVSSDGGSTFGSWTSTTTNVQLGYKLQSRRLSSSSYLDPVTASVTVGATVFSGTVTTMAMPNAAPVIASVATKTFTAQITASDGNGDTLNYTVTTPAAYGTATVNSSGLVTYTAGGGFTGKDSFIVTVSDGNGGTKTAKVKITGASSTGGNISISFGYGIGV